MTPEECRTIDDVRGLLRGVVRAPFGRWIGTLDYSQIEARTLLWLAGDEPGLKVYRSGEDPYVAEAARLFGVEPAAVTKRQRSVGKLAVLALGYGGGRGALTRFADKAGVDLAAVGLDPMDVVEGWRDAHPQVAGRRTGGRVGIVEYWEGAESGWEVARERLATDGEEPAYTIAIRQGGYWRALLRALLDGGTVGGVSYHRDGPDVYCVLPSGRWILYRDVREEDDPERGRAWRYSHPRGRRALWPGLAAENVTQAVCRDLLAAAMLRLDAAGYQIVLHVHDEIVVELADPAAWPDVLRISAELPVWAGGLPLEAGGSVGDRWSK